MRTLYEQIVLGMRAPQPDGEAEALTDILASLHQDPRWQLLEQRALVRLAKIVKEIIREAGTPQALRLAGEAEALMSILAPIRTEHVERNGT